MAAKGTKKTTVSELELAQVSREITIRVAPHGGGWACEVRIGGELVGEGTTADAYGSLDQAMSILYGDTNDYLNGDVGPLARFLSEAKER